MPIAETNNVLPTARVVVIASLVVASWAGSWTAHAAPTTTFLLESAEGGSKSRLSWTFGSDWLSPSSVTPRNSITSVGTYAQAAVDPGTFVSGTFAVSGAGSYANVTTGSSFQIVTLEFTKMNTNDLVVSLKPAGSGILATSSEQLSYTPGTDSYVVDIPFSRFITGTYAFSNQVTTPSNAQTLTITAVPEPGTLMMGVCGIVCGAWQVFRRRFAPLCAGRAFGYTSR
jgi:hypothetical protein